MTAVSDGRLWRSHLEGHVLPWWEAKAVDAELGGVFTCFDNQGHMLSREKYTWSQGRWAWLCAELADAIRAGVLSGDAATWTERAGATSAFLADHAVTPGLQTAFRTDRYGRPLPDGSDGEIATSVFADLFAVLGLSGGLRVDPRPEWLETAIGILLTAEQAIAERTARSEPYPVPPGFRDLAGPMTLLHVADELHRASGSDQAAGVRHRALDNLLGEGGFLGGEEWSEFKPDEAGLAETMLARHRTPGHLLECLWMIVHALERSGGRVDLSRLERLAVRALEIGWDTDQGGLFRYCDAEGGPPRGDPLEPAGPTPYESLVADTWDTKLWWVHVEAMYATALLAQACDSAALGAWHSRVRDYTMTTFPDGEHGEWLQIRDRDGRPLDKVVALPVKDPFHIIRALLFLSGAREHATTAHT